jgi:hypothetical protein
VANDANEGPLRIVRHPFLNLDYWNAYDIFALFLSLAPAPLAATRNNFFLPWTVVFGRWSKLFVSGKLKVPAMLQCTWKWEPRKKFIRFCLGASMGGYSTKLGKNVSGGRWLETLQRARFGLLTEPNTSRVGRWEFGKSPKFEEGQAGGWNFGNCAETYPFLKLLKWVYSRGLLLGQC